MKKNIFLMFCLFSPLIMADTLSASTIEDLRQEYENLANANTKHTYEAAPEAQKPSKPESTEFVNLDPYFESEGSSAPKRKR